MKRPNLMRKSALQGGRLRRRFQLTIHNTGRSFSDDEWETTDSNYVAFWNDATTKLRERSFNWNSTRATVSVDWKPLAHRHSRHLSAMKAIEKAKQKGSLSRRHLELFPRRPAKLMVTVDIAKRAEVRAGTFAEIAIYDAFLIANLAAPSCFDLYRATLSRDDDSSDSRDSLDFSLSNFAFETALMTRLTQATTGAKFLTLQSVLQWFLAVRSTASLLPKNPAEKALFALLRVSNTELSETSIIWIFYGLESLFQTRPGENKATLLRRISMLLELPEDGAAHIKKRMNNLYDLRSAVVHGGLEVIHPVHHELHDPAINDSYGKLMDAADFGYTVLVICIQRLIELEWKWPRYSESFSGEPIR